MMMHKRINLHICLILIISLIFTPSVYANELWQDPTGEQQVTQTLEDANGEATPFEDSQIQTTTDFLNDNPLQKVKKRKKQIRKNFQRDKAQIRKYRGPIDENGNAIAQDPTVDENGNALVNKDDSVQTPDAPDQDQTDPTQDPVQPNTDNGEDNGQDQPTNENDPKEPEEPKDPEPPLPPVPPTDPKKPKDPEKPKVSILDQKLTYEKRDLKNLIHATLSQGGLVPTDANPFGLPKILNEKGWDAYVKSYVQPAIDAGVKTFWFLMPFGRDSYKDSSGNWVREKMNFGTIFNHPKSFVDDFVKAMKTLTDKYPDVKFNVYNGGTELYKGLKSLEGPNDLTISATDPSRNKWWKHVYDGLKPFANAGLLKHEIAFDSSSKLDPSTVTGMLGIALNEMLQNKDKRDEMIKENAYLSMFNDLFPDKVQEVKVRVEALAHYVGKDKKELPFAKQAHYALYRNRAFQALLKDPNDPKYKDKYIASGKLRDVTMQIRSDDYNKDDAKLDSIVKEILEHGFNMTINPYAIVGKSKAATLDDYIKKLGLTKPLPLIVDLNAKGTLAETTKYVITKKPKNGILKLRAGTSIYEYVPNAGFTGTETIEFTADGKKGTLTIEV